jgi:hypothetical protein
MDKLYIPGDLVMTNGIPVGTKKGIVYQVTESNADKYRAVEDGNAFTELKGSVTLSNLKGKTIVDDGFLFCDSGAWVKDIVPIPIAPELLEKNGWREEKDDYINDSYHIRLCEKIDGYSAYKVVNDAIVWLRDVESVSDLQHLFFGLNLNSEMEV